MGFVSTWLFGEKPKPRITKKEWLRIRGNLSAEHHFTLKELEEIESVFIGVMDEEKEKEKGVDSDELVKGIQYIRQHEKFNHISPQKIDALEKEMMKYLTISL